MHAATQMISLAAGYLTPELRRHRVRSFTDLIELLGALYNLFRQALSTAVLAILSDVDSQLRSLCEPISSNAWKSAVAHIRLRSCDQARSARLVQSIHRLASLRFAAPHGRPRFWTFCVFQERLRSDNQSNKQLSSQLG
jgi:hypothetical protein